jgi:AhpD family alkylhydroperoxidase
MTECFDKPVWTLRSVVQELGRLPPHVARVARTAAGRPISSALRERIMLAVAAENRCIYCQLAHGAFGQSAGLAEAEVASILAGRDDPSVGEPAERAALAYARDRARRDFASRDEALWAALSAHYSDEQREAIESTARVMNFANRFGNTFDAARERVAGRCEETVASGVDMAVLSAVFLAAASTVAPMVGLLMLKHRAR